jgi:hypothetical protein
VCLSPHCPSLKLSCDPSSKRLLYGPLISPRLSISLCCRRPTTACVVELLSSSSAYLRFGSRVMCSQSTAECVRLRFRLRSPAGFPTSQRIAVPRLPSENHLCRLEDEVSVFFSSFIRCGRLLARTNHRKILASAAAQRRDFSMGWCAWAWCWLLENQALAARCIMLFLLLSSVLSFDSTNTNQAYLREYVEQTRLQLRQSSLIKVYSQSRWL